MLPMLEPEDCLQGGNAAGAYLDSVGAPFPSLTADQWRTFCCTLVNGANESAGRRMLAAWTIPVGAEG